MIYLLLLDYWVLVEYIGLILRCVLISIDGRFFTDVVTKDRIIIIIRLSLDVGDFCKGVAGVLFIVSVLRNGSVLFIVCKI